eukprot:Em0009g1325a
MSQIHPTTGWYNLPRNGMSIIKKLSKEHDVIINTADKGSSIVLLDREKYVEAGRKHLDDKQTYTRLTADTTDTIKKTITIKLGNYMLNMAALTELLDMITKNNVFEFDGEFYIQTKGVPMGNIMAPSYSGIFMGELETRLIDLQSDKIKLWVRYIDDIFVAWQGTQTDFDNFVQQCNKLHTSIKFSTTEINFLDMTVFKGPNFQQRQKLDIKTFKKTYKQTGIRPWILFSHPPGIGKSIALGESYRALRTNTDKTNFLKQIDSVQNALLSRGYNKQS